MEESILYLEFNVNFAHIPGRNALDSEPPVTRSGMLETSIVLFMRLSSNDVNVGMSPKPVISGFTFEAVITDQPSELIFQGKSRKIIVGYAVPSVSFKPEMVTSAVRSV